MLHLHAGAPLETKEGLKACVPRDAGFAGRPVGGASQDWSSAREPFDCEPEPSIDPTLKDLPLHYVKEFGRRRYDMILRQPDAYAWQRGAFIMCCSIVLPSARIPTFIAPPPGRGRV